jgi:hypothetical protein
MSAEDIRPILVPYDFENYNFEEREHCLSLLRKLEFSPADKLIDVIPEKVQKEIVELLSEREKAVDSIDPMDRKLHTLQVELLDFIIRKQINDYAEKKEPERSIVK